MTSGERLPRLARAALDADQSALHDAIAGGPRAAGPQLFRLVDDDGRLEGPFGAFLLQPRLGHALQALGAAVRYETSLTGRAREIAILVVAAHWDSEFEWYAHTAVGRHVGLSEDELAAVRERHYDQLPSGDACVAETTRRLVADGDLDDEAYGEAVDTLGLPRVFELTTLVGYYATLALQLRVFRIASPDS